MTKVFSECELSHLIYLRALINDSEVSCNSDKTKTTMLTSQCNDNGGILLEYSGKRHRYELENNI